MWERSNERYGAGIDGQNVVGSGGRGLAIAFVIGTERRSKIMIGSSHCSIVLLRVTSFHADFMQVRSGSGDGFDPTIRLLLLNKEQFCSKF